MVDKFIVFVNAESKPITGNFRKSYSIVVYP
jgi:hypothetical protein